MSNPETLNAKITKVFLGTEDHGIFTCMIHLDYGHSGQGFGGYRLDGLGGFGCEWIKKLLEVTDSRDLSQVEGKYVRAVATRNKVIELKHITKDITMNPEEIVARIKLKLAGKENTL